MPRIEVTQNLQRHVACPPAEVSGRDVREVLEALFARVPQLRSYLLDDQGAVRKHVVVFVDGEQIRDRTQLTDRVHESSSVYVMQALSGGRP